MSQHSVVITAANIHPDAAALLGNYRVIYADVRASEKSLMEMCRAEQPSAILVRYGNISENVIGASSKLRVIAKHGVGTDNIDKSAAARLGIPVTAALGSNSQSVAEITLGLILSCARQLAWLDARMRSGHWDRDHYAGIELSGSTLGLIGAGAIGQRVARMALAMGMEVLVCAPRVAPGSLPSNVQLVDIETLVTRANVVSLHCPLVPETRNLLDASRLARLQDRTIVINTSRAGLIDEPALLKHLHANRLFAGIDCFEEEPLAPDSPWRSAPNAVLTPHIAGSTTTAFRQMGVMAAQSIVHYLTS